VKKQTVILVLIGVILFIAGSAIAYASVQGASKNGNGATNATVTSTAVVAKSDIPAGTTGQAMVSEGLVALEILPANTYSPTDLSTLTALNDEVLTAPVAKGHAVTSTVLAASTSNISLPQGMNAVTVALSGTEGLAGYLQPGSRVDVYANITKTSAGPSATLPIPCTELAAANIEVMDVQSTAPSFSSHPSSTGRTVPTAETLLLALTPNQARNIEFLSQNETISVVQTQQDLGAPPVNVCIGTNQTTQAP
jgi:Flp pilus assembly protein CpaB